MHVSIFSLWARIQAPTPPVNLSATPGCLCQTAVGLRPHAQTSPLEFSICLPTLHHIQSLAHYYFSSTPVADGKVDINLKIGRL